VDNEIVLIDREALIAELRRSFDEQTAEVLLRVLDKVASQVTKRMPSREEIAELWRMSERLMLIHERAAGELAALRASQEETDRRLAELAQAQARTEESISRLSQGLDRLEAQVQELAAAQRRTEERLQELEVRVGELAEAQRRTERRVEELAEAQRRTERALEALARQVGGLSETVGGDIEDIAYIVLHDVLKREFGWEVGALERAWHRWNGSDEEVDVFGQAIDPNRPGTTIWIVGEAKHNLTAREVERFIDLVRRAKQHLDGEIFPVCFCYRARPEVQEMILDAGLRLVFSYGRLV